MADELILDATVAAKCFFHEDGSEIAQPMVASGVRLVAPDLIHTEFAAIAALKARRGETTPEIAAAAVAHLGGLLDISVPVTPLVSRAAALAKATGCSAEEGVYLALAEQRGRPLITADAGLVGRVTYGGLGHLIELL